MLKHNQDGAGNAVIVLILTIILLVTSVGFGVWAFMGRQDYKDNVDAKVSSAVQTAKAQQDTLDNQKFAEANKSPLQVYNGPQTYGSVQLSFPKTWGAYVDDTGSGDPAINGYFYPSVVPAVDDNNSVFALRIKVLSQSYSDVVQTFSGQQTLKFSAYSLPKVPKAVGIRIKGSLSTDTGQKTVDMIVLPVRSQTLEVWTEGTQFGGDFETYILPNLSFSP